MADILIQKEPKDFPFYEVADECEKLIERGVTIFQKFTCGNCGSRQTIEEPNKFYTHGKCEECGHTTDIVAAGCNYLAHITGKKE